MSFFFSLLTDMKSFEHNVDLVTSNYILDWFYLPVFQSFMFILYNVIGKDTSWGMEYWTLLQQIADFIGFLSTACASFIFITYNPVYSVLGMVFSFVLGSILFFVLRLDFFGYIFLIVYVGAIAVLFLFIVMMFDIKIKKKDNIEDFRILSFLKNNGLILLISLVTFLCGRYIFMMDNFFLTNTIAIKESFNYRNDIDFVIRYFDIGILNKIGQFSHNIEMFSDNINRPAFNEYSETNLLHYINLLKIYNEFSPLLLLSGIILLIGMIGSIVLAMSSVSGTDLTASEQSSEMLIKRQDTVQQFNRSSKIVRVIRENELPYFNSVNAKF